MSCRHPLQVIKHLMMLLFGGGFQHEEQCALGSVRRGGDCGAQVLERIKEPLQTLMSRDHYETAYAVLAHFLLLAQRAPSLFSQARCSMRCAVCRVTKGF